MERKKKKKQKGLSRWHGNDDFNFPSRKKKKQFFSYSSVGSKSIENDRLHRNKFLSCY